MTDPITKFIPTNTPIFDDDPDGQAERKQRNIIRTNYWEEGQAPGGCHFYTVGRAVMITYLLMGEAKFQDAVLVIYGRWSIYFDLS